jgi:methionyl-tRNA synthetase
MSSCAWWTTSRPSWRRSCRIRLCYAHACAPHRAQKLHEYLGYDGQLFGTQHVVEYQEETRSHQALTYDHGGAVGTWAASVLPPGQPLRPPAPLFKKLDESVIEEEYARLEG